MSNTSGLPVKASVSGSRSKLIASILAIIVGAGIAFDTKIVQIGSKDDVRQAAFSPDSYGAEHFPQIKAVIEQRAVEAKTLAPEILADKAAAAKKYGTPASTGSIMLVRLTGVAGDQKAGIYKLTVEGLPPSIGVRVQTGPAINGTDLRDAPGDIAFGQFKNQIDYQNAGSAINREMKKLVLANIDTTNLTGKSLEIVGAFRLVNPENWLITPVAVTVK